MKAINPPHFLKHAPACLGIACITVISSSCLQEKADPSYEKEALKLSAEKAAIEEQLKQSKREIETLREQVQRAEAERDAIKDQAAQASGKIDPEKIKLGFAKAVSELGQQIEEKHPDYSVASVTFQKMSMPTDYPFSSGVMTTIISKASGEKRNLYWEAQGNPKGEWRFAQKAAPTNNVAQQNVPSQPSGNDASTASNNNGNSGQQPTQPKPNTPSQPQPRKPKPVSGGNVHVIDWGKLR